MAVWKRRSAASARRNPDTYAARQVANIDRGWRERALIALARVGDETALSEVKKLAASPNDAFAATAKRALEERAEKPPQ
jgi:hypothetical protein